MNTAGTVRIGISGWTYPPWRGTFYPDKLPHKNELKFAAGIFNSIEVNGTFYTLQKPASYARWAQETPDDFVFSLKGPRFLTHIRRLKDAEQPLANFFSSGLFALGRKLGPILWQLPPNFRYQPDLLERFLSLLPHHTEQAALLAKKHDSRMSGRSMTEALFHQPIRHAIEIRNDTFAVPEFIELLRKYEVALVCADTVEWPRRMDITSDFVYCRLHGSEELYVSGYNDEALATWARRVVAWASGSEPEDAEKVVDSAPSPQDGRDVFVYFDNDAKVRSPVDAQSLRKRVENLPRGKL
jgi:uncharacterized protein YecE (DUF72 family)